MIEKKEYKGYFFLPEKPDVKVSGTLYFYPNETIRLELIGSCLSKNADGGSSCKPEKIETIWGVVKTEERRVSKITLFNNHGSRGKSSSNSQNCMICMATYTCNYLLLGGHLANKEDKMFNKIRASFPFFNDWYRSNGIQFAYEGCWIGVYKTMLEPSAKPLIVQLNDSQSLSLLGYSLSYDLKPHQKCLIELSLVEFETTEKMDFRDLLINIGWFRDFYSFAAMTAMPFSEIHLYDNTNNRYSLFYVEETKFEKKDEWYHHDFLFDFEKIYSDFEHTMQKWYEKKKDSEPMIQQLISSVTPRQFIKNSDFLTVIQAIEGYYRRFIGDKSLTEILNCLYDRYKDIPIIVKNKPDVDLVRISRNYYSHLLPEEEKKNVCKSFELFGLAEKLTPLLVACLLTLVGFDNEKINEFMQGYVPWKGSFLIET